MEKEINAYSSTSADKYSSYTEADREIKNSFLNYYSIITIGSSTAIYINAISSIEIIQMRNQVDTYFIKLAIMCFLVSIVFSFLIFIFMKFYIRLNKEYFIYGVDENTYGSFYQYMYTMFILIIILCLFASILNSKYFLSIDFSNLELIKGFNSIVVFMYIVIALSVVLPIVFLYSHAQKISAKYVYSPQGVGFSGLEME